jgi:transglutaminase-like putative cysteine protease
MLSLLLSFLSSLSRRAGPHSLASLGLLGGILLCLSLGLSAALRGVELRLLLPAAFLGLAVAWRLGREPRLGWWGLLIAAALGLAFILILIGGLGDEIGRVLRAWDGQLLVQRKWAAQWAALRPVSVELWRGLGALSARFFAWGKAFAAGGAGYDPVSSAFFWTLLIWMTSAWAGWAQRGLKRPLAAVAPAAVLLAGVLNYQRAGPALLLPVLASALALNAVSGHAWRERRWSDERIDYSEDVRFDLFFGAGMTILVVVLMAAFLPSLSLQRIFRFYRPPVQVQSGGKAGESLGLQRRPPPPGPLTQPDFPLLPRVHLLGSGPELAREVVMIVRTGELSPMPPDLQAGLTVPRHYWRALTYARYTGYGWLESGSSIVNYAAGTDALPGEWADHKLLVQQVEPRRSLGGLLHATGQLVGADRDYQIAWRLAPPEGDAPVNPEQVDLFGAAIGGGSYTARSLVPQVSAEQLRNAGMDYPKWITERYLALPERVPARVLGLARSLTATAPTPYDRAAAIQDYLRTYPYNLDLPAPPRGREVSDYFLFDLREGFCDYYATAMVVLARAAGLPARLVAGYAPGSYDAANASYVVTEADAHSWPEIYFPGYGWIEFEPTAGRPAIDRSQNEALTGRSGLPAEQAPGGVPVHSPLGQTWGTWAAAILGLAGSAWLAAVLVDARRLHRLSPEKAVRTLYRRMYRAGLAIAPPPDRGATPYEFLAGLAAYLRKLASLGQWKRTFQPADREALQMTELYLRAVYSPHPTLKSDQKTAILTWNKLRWRLRLAWLVRRRSSS